MLGDVDSLQVIGQGWAKRGLFVFSFLVILDSIREESGSNRELHPHRVARVQAEIVRCRLRSVPT